MGFMFTKSCIGTSLPESPWMGKDPSGEYATASLKAYPGDLCQAQEVTQGGRCQWRIARGSRTGVCSISTRRDAERQDPNVSEWDFPGILSTNMGDGKLRDRYRRYHVV